MARSPQLITIYWRDIPAQVNAKSRTDKHQVLLKPRFQKAIDRAAMVADITTASEYVNEWRREAVAIDGDLSEAAQTEADRIDAEFGAERLEELVHAGGFDTAKTNGAIKNNGDGPSGPTQANPDKANPDPGATP